MWHKETRLGNNTAQYKEGYGPYFFELTAAKEAADAECDARVCVLQISDDGGLERLWAYADQAEFLKPLQKWKGCYGHVVISELQEA